MRILSGRERGHEGNADSNGVYLCVFCVYEWCVYVMVVCVCVMMM